MQSDASVSAEYAPPDGSDETEAPGTQAILKVPDRCFVARDERVPVVSTSRVQGHSGLVRGRSRRAEAISHGKSAVRREREEKEKHESEFYS